MDNLIPASHLLISTVQKIALYETKARLYIVGSNNTETKFRVLKIDRTEAKELIVNDGKVEYSQKELRDLLTMIDMGNRPKQGQRHMYGAGLNRTVSAYGIVGFVKFLEGYYVILITKRRRIALIGHHTIYKIEDTSMIYIPNHAEKALHPEEARYVKTFQNVDLSSNFYFSYSYDLTRTLQYNLAPVKKPVSDSGDEIEMERTAPFWNPQIHVEEGSIETAENFLESLQPKREDYIRLQYHLHGPRNMDDTFSSSGSNEIWSELQINDQQHTPISDVTYGIRSKPNSKFVWNLNLLKPAELHQDWILSVTHGFVGQSHINVFGKGIYLTLIARRSNKFAGTRFLKRGANFMGDVANEVETEQVVHDSLVSSLSAGHFTSFVQMRGSIPSHWSQDISKMVPKPPISLDIADPYCCTAGRHFNELLKRYGSPILCLNLVKKREQKKHESMLSEEFINAIAYLNQFLSSQHHIEHIGFDMARINKLKEANVLTQLSDIAYYVIRRTGIFQSWSPYYCQTLQPQPRMGGYRTSYGTVLQTGIVRVNCVDCLDRTNTAQFALGKCALAFQLYALGVLQKPTLVFDTDSVRMLEELYEDHGDTLALQYGGSQLVHRIKTYRKIAPLSSHSRDIMQTLSRYYSNTFSDADKQNAINLFLQVYKLNNGFPSLWDFVTDYYMHNPNRNQTRTAPLKPYTQWWDEEVAKCLPLSYDETNKGCGDTVLELTKTHLADERIDGYFDHYRPYEMTIFSDLFSFNMSHSVKDFMPNFATDYSPFSVRVRPGKRRESMGTEKPPNPSVTGISSTTSTSSSTSETDSEESNSDDEQNYFLDSEASVSISEPTPKSITFESLFSTMKQTYGQSILEPNDHDFTMYKKYVSIGKFSTPETPVSKHLEKPRTPIKSFFLIRQSAFPLDSSELVTPPNIGRSDRDIYKAYVQKGQKGASTLSHQSLLVYQSYVSSKFQ